MAKKLSFEERMESLETIVRNLEDGEFGLDQAVDQYQAGVKLLADLRRQLDRMEKKIEALTADGEVRPLPLDGDDDE